MKTDINKILKPGATLKYMTIDFNSPQMKRKLKELRKQCEIIESNSKVDWDRISRIYFTI